MSKPFLEGYYNTKASEKPIFHLRRDKQSVILYLHTDDEENMTDNEATGAPLGAMGSLFGE